MNKRIEELVDINAEAGVISSLIYHPEYLLSDNNLQPRFFYGQDNQLLFWAIEELVNNGVTTIDSLNLKNVLNSNPSVKESAEQYGLSDIRAYIDTAKSAVRGTYEEYKLLANTVISNAFRRDLYNFSGDMGNECLNLELSLDDLNDYVNNGISKIVDKFVFGTDTIQFGEKIDDIWKEICNDRNKDGTSGIPNLIPSLDDYFTFGKGELVLVAGETGKGKSSFFLAQTVFTLRKGIPCGIIDSELTDKVFLPRILANLSGVCVKTIKNGTYTKKEEERISKSLEYLKNCAGLFHEYMPVFSKLKVDQICRKWYNQDKLGFLVYDYIKPSEKYGAAEISQSMGLLADYLKSVAGNLNIPVLAGLQLNRMTGELADSFKTERYADVLLYWKEKPIDLLQRDTMECGNFMMQVIKNRNGNIHDPNDYVDIRFIGDQMRIYETQRHRDIPMIP